MKVFVKIVIAVMKYVSYGLLILGLELLVFQLIRSHSGHTENEIYVCAAGWKYQSIGWCLFVLRCWLETLGDKISQREKRQ